MAFDEKEKKFMQLRAIHGKSLETISKKIGVPLDTLLDWDFQFVDEMIDLKALEYDKIVEKYKLSNVNRFKYLAELYDRLKNELNTRDFTGLPTDKLYDIFTDVYFQIQDHLQSESDEDWDEIPEDFEEYEG